MSRGTVSLDEHCCFVVRQLKRLRYERTFQDACLVAGSEKFYISRLLLAAFSPYFEELLKMSLVIATSGTSPVILRLLVDFMYEGVINVTPDLAEPLIRAAKEFQITGLKDCDPSRLQQHEVNLKVSYLSADETTTAQQVCREEDARPSSCASLPSSGAHHAPVASPSGTLASTSVSLSDDDVVEPQANELSGQQLCHQNSCLHPLPLPPTQDQNSRTDSRAKKKDCVLARRRPGPYGGSSRCPSRIIAVHSTTTSSVSSVSTPSTATVVSPTLALAASQSVVCRTVSAGSPSNRYNAGITADSTSSSLFPALTCDRSTTELSISQCSTPQFLIPQCSPSGHSLRHRSRPPVATASNGSDSCDRELSQSASGQRPKSPLITVFKRPSSPVGILEDSNSLVPVSRRNISSSLSVGDSNDRELSQSASGPRPNSPLITVFKRPSSPVEILENSNSLFPVSRRNRCDSLDSNIIMPICERLLAGMDIESEDGESFLGNATSEVLDRASNASSPFPPSSPLPVAASLQSLGSIGSTANSGHPFYPVGLQRGASSAEGNGLPDSPITSPTHDSRTVSACEWTSFEIACGLRPESSDVRHEHVRHGCHPGRSQSQSRTRQLSAHTEGLHTNGTSADVEGASLRLRRPRISPSKSPSEHIIASNLRSSAVAASNIRKNDHTDSVNSDQRRRVKKLRTCLDKSCGRS